VRAQTQLDPATVSSAAGPQFPEDGSFGPGRSERVPGGTVTRYATLAPELAGALARWLAEGAVREGTPLKPPFVHRLGGLIVKLFPPPSVFGLFRKPRSQRSAERYFDCLPVRTPRPLAAFAGGIGSASLLVREYVAGALLAEVWAEDERADEDLALFLARMNRQGLFHGDLHPRNLLWSGEWVLLDPDGLRHGLHDWKRVLEGQWARFLVHLEGRERVERLFRRVAEHGRALGGLPVEVDWTRVLAREGALRATRERTLGNAR